MSIGKVTRFPGGATPPVGLGDGGTGAVTAAGARANLDSIPTALAGMALGPIRLDSEGKVDPVMLGLRTMSQPSVDGPASVAYGTTAIYQITNYDSFTSYDIKAIAGTVVLNDDKIHYTAPNISEGQTVGGFTINGRDYTVRHRRVGLAKPSITFPASGQILSTVSNLKITSSSMLVTDGNVVAYGEVQGSNSTGLVLVDSASHSELMIRLVSKGGDGYYSGNTAITGQTTRVQFGSGDFIDFAGGIGGAAQESERFARITPATPMKWSTPSGSEIRYTTYSSSVTLAAMEWQVSATGDFLSRVVDTGPVSTYNDGLPFTTALRSGTLYYVRVRHHGSDGSVSEWSTPISFVMPGTGAVQTPFTSSYEFPLVDTTSGSTNGDSLVVSYTGGAVAKGFGIAVQQSLRTWSIYRPSSADGASVNPRQPRHLAKLNSENLNRVFIAKSADAPDGKVGYVTNTTQDGSVAEDISRTVTRGAIVGVQTFRDRSNARNVQLYASDVASTATQCVAISLDKLYAYVANNHEITIDIFGISGENLVSNDANSTYQVDRLVNTPALYEWKPYNQDYNTWAIGSESHAFASNVMAVPTRRHSGVSTAPDFATQPTVHSGGNANVSGDEVVVAVPSKHAAGTTGAAENMVFTSWVRQASTVSDTGVTITSNEVLPWRYDRGYVLPTLFNHNGGVDSVASLTPVYTSAMSRDGRWLAIANQNDYGGRGVVSVYRRRESVQSDSFVSGTLTAIGLEVGSNAPSGYTMPTTDATLRLRGSFDGFMGMAPSIITDERLTTDAGTAYSVSRRLWLADIALEPGSTDNRAFTAKAVYETEFGERAPLKNEQVRLLYSGTLTITPGSTTPNRPWVLWDLVSVIPGPETGAAAYGKQLAIDDSGSTLVVGYQDTTNASAMVYDVFGRRDYDLSAISATRQAIRPLGGQIDLTSAIDPRTVLPTRLQLDNVMGFALGKKTGVAGAPQTIRYGLKASTSATAVSKVMTLVSVTVSGDYVTLTYHDSENEKVATYRGRIVDGGTVSQCWGKLNKLTPTFTDGRALAVSGDGNRVFVGHQGSVWWSSRVALS